MLKNAGHEIRPDIARRPGSESLAHLLLLFEPLLLPKFGMNRSKTEIFSGCFFDFLGFAAGGSSSSINTISSDISTPVGGADGAGGGGGAAPCISGENSPHITPAGGLPDDGLLLPLLLLLRLGPYLPCGIVCTRGGGGSGRRTVSL